MADDRRSCWPSDRYSLSDVLGILGSIDSPTRYQPESREGARVIALGYQKSTGYAGELITQFADAVKGARWTDWKQAGLTKQDFSVDWATKKVIPTVPLEPGEDLFEHVFKKDVIPKTDYIMLNVTGMSIRHLAHSPPLDFVTEYRLTQAELMYCISCPNILDRMTFWQLWSPGKTNGRFLVVPTDQVIDVINEPGIWRPRLHVQDPP